MIHPQPQRYHRGERVVLAVTPDAKEKPKEHKISCFKHRERKFNFTRKEAVARDYYQWIYCQPCELCTRCCCKENFSYHGALCILIFIKLMCCYLGVASFASFLVYHSSVYPERNDWANMRKKYDVWAALSMLFHCLQFIHYFFFFHHLRNTDRKHSDIWFKTCWVLPLLSIGICVYAGIKQIYIAATLILYCGEVVWLLFELWMWYEARKQLKAKEPTDLGVRGLTRPRELRVQGIELPTRLGGYERSTYMEAQQFLLRNNAHVKPIPTVMDTNLYLLKKREERIRRGEDDDDEEDRPGGLYSPWKVGRKGSIVHIRDFLAGHKPIKGVPGPSSKLRNFNQQRRFSENPNKKVPAAAALDLLEHRMEQKGKFAEKRNTLRRKSIFFK